MAKEFIVSGDSHVVEPVDLYKTRLPKNMRDQALWEEDTILDEPLVPGGHTRVPHRAHARVRGLDRVPVPPVPRPDPGRAAVSSILRDLDRDGVDATMLFPNLSFFALYTDIHERSIAHARVYNDWLAETYLPYSSRLRPAAAIPTTDAADAVKEIERAVRLGLTALILPEIPQPFPYWAPEYEPIWEAAEANGLPIFFHVASGGVDSKAGTSATGSQVKGILTAMTMGKQELTGALLAGRTMGGGSTAAASPMRIIADLVSSGVCERHPNLMFNVIEFNAGWLANYMGSMDKAWRTGTGQDPHWWLGFWDDGVDPHDQKLMGRMFKINDRWPLPLKPSEYVRRNIRVQFADDRIAVHVPAHHRGRHHLLGQRLPARGGHLPRQPGGHRGAVRGRARRGPGQDTRRQPGQDRRLRRLEEAGPGDSPALAEGSALRSKAPVRLAVLAAEGGEALPEQVHQVGLAVDGDPVGRRRGPCSRARRPP